ncbi:MAG: hypothetical protein KBT27_11415 [Prevotellaceae bacterium]|nr:hypothetical protein [Candidatus Faecinaster equi]
MNELNERFNEILSKVCGNNKSRMADVIGVSEGSIRLYSQGKDPSAQALIGICKKLGVSPKWLLLGDGEMFEIDKNTNEQTTDKNVASYEELINIIKSLQSQNEKLQDKLMLVLEKSLGSN